MSRTARRVVRLVRATAAAAAALALTGAPARGGMITQTASLPLTTTNFGAGNAQTAPLVFQQFDTMGGARQLSSVSLTFSAMIENQFGMRFTTPATITDSVATGNAAAPGPSITLYQPDGRHTLLTVSAPNDPSVLTRSVTYGNGPGQAMSQSFSSLLPTNSPYYIAPAISQGTNSLNLTAPADLAVFTGGGKVALPVSAQAISKFLSTSGNGFGSVSTQGTAEATVVYNYATLGQETGTPGGPPSSGGGTPHVPEPAAVILWGVGGLGMMVAHRWRRRRRD